MKIARMASVIIAMTAVFLSGCATSKLWEADHFARHREPAPEAHLRLFQSEPNRDVLVEYNELQPGKGNIRRRVYFLYQNDAKVRALRKPEFQNRAATNFLKPIPLYRQQPETGTEPVDLPYAVASTNGHQFTLFCRDNRLGEAYELPTYRVSSGRWIQLLLTPPALIADATIVGGFLIVLWWPTGYSFSL